MDQIKLGYWKVRGRAQISRLLLAYTEADWVDVQYQGKQKWFEKDKKQLGLNFPNLPYLIEGDFSITETNAVQKYIIQRSEFKGLLGKNAKEAAVIENVINVLADIRVAVVARTMWGDANTWKDKKQQCFESIRAKMDQVAAFVGEKEYALGEISYLDFLIQQFSHYVQIIFPEEYGKYAFLGRIRNNFNELPKIKAYYERPDAIKGPFIAGTANMMF